jgi:hypothetical protein
MLPEAFTDINVPESQTCIGAEFTPAKIIHEDAHDIPPLALGKGCQR